jgi:hypothetical protein
MTVSGGMVHRAGPYDERGRTSQKVSKDRELSEFSGITET